MVLHPGPLSRRAVSSKPESAPRVADGGGRAAGSSRCGTPGLAGWGEDESTLTATGTDEMRRADVFVEGGGLQ